MNSLYSMTWMCKIVSQIENSNFNTQVVPDTKLESSALIWSSSSKDNSMSNTFWFQTTAVLFPYWMTLENVLKLSSKLSPYWMTLENVLKLSRFLSLNSRFLICIIRIRYITHSSHSNILEIISTKRGGKKTNLQVILKKIPLIRTFHAFLLPTPQHSG